MTACTVTDCQDTPFLLHPLNLCRQHALMVSLNVTDLLHANALSRPATKNDITEKASVATDDVWEQNSHPAVVYFLTNGDRVKIGTSTNITARVVALALRKGNAALLLQGGYDLEEALHIRFEADRIGRTEWFVLSGQIRDYIAQHEATDAALKQPPVPAEDLTWARAHVRSTRKPIAEEVILSALRASGATYTDRTELLAATGLKEGTFANALGKLETAGKLHRITEGRTVRVALGPAPAGE